MGKSVSNRTMCEIIRVRGGVKNLGGEGGRRLDELLKCSKINSKELWREETECERQKGGYSQFEDVRVIWVVQNMAHC